MIPTIGVMIGAYIFTRMIELIVNRTNPNIALKVLAAITAVVTVICVLDLVIGGSTRPASPLQMH